MRINLITALLSISVWISGTANGQTTIPVDPYHLLHLKRLAESTVYKANLQETFENGHYNINLPPNGTAQYLRTVVNFIGKAADNCIELNVDATRKFKLDMITAQLYHDVNELLEEASSQIQLYRSDKDINGYLEIPGGKYWDLPGVPSSMDIDANSYFPTVPTQGLMRDVTRQTPTDKFLNIYVVDEILLGGVASDIKSTSFNKIIIDQSSDQDLASIIVETKYVDPSSQSYEPGVLVEALGQYLGLLPTYSGSVNGQCPPEWNEINGIIPNLLAPLDPVFGDGIEATEMMPNNITSCNVANPCNSSQGLLDPQTAANVMAGLPCSNTFDEEQKKIMHRFINEYLSDVIYGKSFLDEEASFDDCNPGVIQIFDGLVYEDGIPLLLSGVKEMDLEIIEVDAAGYKYTYDMTYEFPVPMTGVFFHKFQWLRGIYDKGFFLSYKITAEGVCGTQTIAEKEVKGGDVYVLPGCATTFLFLENYEEGKYMASDPPVFKRTTNKRAGRLAMDGVDEREYNFGPFYDTYDMSAFDVKDGALTIASTERGKYGNFYGNETGDVVNVNLFDQTQLENASLSLGELGKTTGNISVESGGVLNMQNVAIEIHNASALVVKDGGRMILKGDNSINFTAPTTASVTVLDGAVLEIQDNVTLDIQGVGKVRIDGDLLLADNMTATINIGANVQLDIAGQLQTGTNSRLNISGSGIVNLSHDALVLGDDGILSVNGLADGTNMNVNVASTIDVTNAASLWIKNVNLTLKTSSTISSNGSFRMDASQVTAEGTSLNGRIILYGQDDTRLIGNTFRDIPNTAIVLNNYGVNGAYRTIVSNNTFVNCENPVLSYGKGIYATGNTFVGDEKSFGITQFNSTIDSWIAGNEFDGYYNAIEFYGANTGEVLINSTNFVDNYYALVAENEDVVMSCSRIASGLPYVNQAISFTPSIPPAFQFDFEVQRDAGLSLYNCQLDVSDHSLNNFTNLEYAIKAEKSKSIFINEGGNVFNNPGYALAGELDPKYDALYYNGSAYEIDGYTNVIPRYQLRNGVYPVNLNTFHLLTSTGDEVALNTDNLPSMEVCGDDGIDNPVKEPIDIIQKIIEDGVFNQLTLLVNGTPVVEVFEKAMLDVSNENDRRNTPKAIEALLDILALESGIASPSDMEKYLFQLAFDELLKAYGTASYHEEIVLNKGIRNAALDNVTGSIINYMDAKIAYLDAVDASKYVLDKAVVLGIGQYFDQAIAVLEAHTFTDAEYVRKATQYTCTYIALDAYWNAEISEMELTARLMECMPRPVRSQNRTGSYEYSETIDKSDMITSTGIQAFPNILGADQNTLRIKSVQETVEAVSIFNILGENVSNQVMVEGLGTEYVQINTAVLSDGVYLINIATANQEVLEKIVIQK